MLAAAAAKVVRLQAQACGVAWWCLLGKCLEMHAIRVTNASGSFFFLFESLIIIIFLQLRSHVLFFVNTGTGTYFIFILFVQNPSSFTCSVA